MQEQLIQKEHYFRSLIHNIHEDIMVIDRQYVITDVNNRVMITTGKPRDEVIGKHCYEVTHDLNVPCSEVGEECLLQRVFADGRARNCRHQHSHADGSKRSIDILLSPLTDKEGNVSHVIEAMRNVSDMTEAVEAKNRAEFGLREGEERYRSLFENMLDGYAYCRMVYDETGQPVDFVYLIVNQAFEKLTGLSRQMVIDKRVTEAIPGIRETGTDFLAIYGRVASTGEPARFETYFEPLQKWLTISAYCPRNGYFVAVFDDITERKRAEEAIKESQKELAAVFEGSPVAMILVDGERRVRRASRAALGFTSRTEEDILGLRGGLWLF